MSSVQTGLKLPRSLARQLEQHVWRGVPNEVCGMLGGRGDLVETVVPIRNVSPRPLEAFEMDPQELFNTLTDLEARSLDLLAIYHSHPPGTSNTLSVTDIERAYYPDSLYLVALPDQGRGGVSYQLYRITIEKVVTEVSLEII